MIHTNINGKPKCGSKSWRWANFNVNITDDPTAVNCKKCLGTVRKGPAAIELTENLVGKILHYSWGYDMTINEFYLIVKQGSKSVLAEKIGTTGAGEFAGHETPDPSKRLRTFVRFLVKPSWNAGEVNFIGAGHCASIHNGGATYYNTLD